MIRFSTFELKRKIEIDDKVLNEFHTDSLIFKSIDHSKWYFLFVVILSLNHDIVLFILNLKSILSCIKNSINEYEREGKKKIEKCGKTKNWPPTE